MVQHPKEFQQTFCVITEEIFCNGRRTNIFAVSAMFYVEVDRQREKLCGQVHRRDLVQRGDEKVREKARRFF